MQGVLTQQSLHAPVEFQIVYPYFKGVPACAFVQILGLKIISLFYDFKTNDFVIYEIQ